MLGEPVGRQDLGKLKEITEDSPLTIDDRGIGLLMAMEFDAARYSPPKLTEILRAAQIEAMRKDLNWEHRTVVCSA